MGIKRGVDHSTNSKAKKSVKEEAVSTPPVVVPPPPPKDEEQISECPDWINKQVCDSFRTCPYFHDGVECDTWVEYGTCPEKEKGGCKLFHHRSIWIEKNNKKKEK